MPWVVSEKLSEILAVRRSIQELAFEQLIEDFVVHLEKEYRYVIRRSEITKDVSIMQWLGTCCDYKTLINGYGDTSLQLNEIRRLVYSIASFNRFAEALEKALNDKYPAEDGGYLHVQAVGDDQDIEHQVVVTFRYDPLYGWGD